jgi:phosphatidylserine/phosphatidylglycerophosphate/cardiolipin synthase-like enzyme
VSKVQIQTINLATLERLRSQLHLSDRVIANTLNDPLGAVHTKFALVFDETSAVGFTGGIDPVDAPPNDRFSKTLHERDGAHSDGFAHTWHDVMAQVEGDIVQEFFDFFRAMWNALAAPVTTTAASSEFRYDDLDTQQPKTLQGTPVVSTIVSARVLPSNPGAIGSTMRVQSLRTVPKPSFQPFWGGSAPTSLPFNRPTIEGATEGIFETEFALRKAIAAADSYIYVEDQKMEGSVLFSYLRAALQDSTRPNLKIILLTGQVDPADPPPAERDQVLREFLTDGLQPEQLDRIVFFEHQLAVIHSKLWIIDDKFAYIGSANIFNRAMFMEIEHGISFVHEGATSTVEKLRRDLWGEHFRLRPADSPEGSDRGDLFSLENALAIWNPQWFPSATPSFTLPIYTNDDLKFRRRWIDGLITTTFAAGLNSRSPSLCPLDLPVRNLFGGIETETLGGHEYQKWRLFNRVPKLLPVRDSAPQRNPDPPTPPPATALGVDFIDDPTLPSNEVSSGEKGLTDEWVIIFQTPSTPHVRKIVDHIDRRIFFAPLPFTPAIATLDYGLLTAVLKPVPLPRPITGVPLLPPWYFLVTDPKVDY